MCTRTIQTRSFCVPSESLAACFHLESVQLVQQWLLLTPQSLWSGQSLSSTILLSLVLGGDYNCQSLFIIGRQVSASPPVQASRAWKQLSFYWMDFWSVSENAVQALYEWKVSLYEGFVALANFAAIWKVVKTGNIEFARHITGTCPLNEFFFFFFWSWPSLELSRRQLCCIGWVISRRDQVVTSVTSTARNAAFWQLHYFQF